ncbi:NAD(P)H-dependent glycerol-3-phosphate dehydrogenase [Candidatus Woesearchaeota archaeon]|nr:NAD(P)H-dependent glycerol-3-phosphate dehydrogenase [Candidatus Woesearchaeota archaeon]
MVKKIAVVGAGAFGYALALLLSKTHSEIQVYAYDVIEEVITTLQETKHHPYFHKDCEISSNLIPTSDKEEGLKDAEVVLLAVPAQYLRGALESLKDLVPQEAILLNVSKALEKGTNKRMSEVISEFLSNPTATISGGMLAGDVAHGLPVGADIGCTDEHALKVLKDLFTPTTVHVETTIDIIGVEFAGAFKNLIAIGGGIIDGLKFGTSTKAFFITQSLREVELLAITLGAKKKTFHTASNAWMGDLMTTCFGDSRNRLFGEMIGQGNSVEDVIKTLAEQKKHAEGYVTIKLVNELLEQHNLKRDFVGLLYRVVYEGANAKEEFSKISLIQNN